MRTKALLKIVTLLFCPLLTLTGFAQDQNANTPWNWGIWTSYEYNGLRIQHSPDKFEYKPGIGFAVGANLDRQVLQNIWIGLGVNLGHKNFEHTDNKVLFSSDIDLITGEVNYSQRELDVSVHELYFPFRIQLANSSRTIYLGAEFGAGKHFTTNNHKQTFHHSDGTKTELPVFIETGLVYAVGVDAGFTRPISEKLSMGLSPYFKYYLSDYLAPAANLYNIGLRVTLNGKI